MGYRERAARSAFVVTALLTACQGSAQPVREVVPYPTEAPSEGVTHNNEEVAALDYLEQMYPGAYGVVTGSATKEDGNTVLFVSAVEGMQIEPYMYMTFQGFLRDNAEVLLPDVFTVETSTNHQVVYLVPRSAIANSTDPLAGVNRTIQFKNGACVTIIIIEPDGSYPTEDMVTEIAQATYHETTLNVTGVEPDPYQEVLANSIGLAYKLIFEDGLDYEQYVNAVRGMVFDINGTMYNVEVLSPYLLNYAIYLSNLPPGLNGGFIKQTP